MYFYCTMSKLEVEFSSPKPRYGQESRFERSIEKKSMRALHCALEI